MFGKWGWELALLPLCIASVGYSLWAAFGQAHVGPVAIDPLDIGLAFALTCWGIQFVREGIADPTPTTWFAAVCLMSVLFAPVLVGAAQGHDLQSVLRQARVTACFSLVAIAPQLMKDRRAAERIILSLVCLTTAAAAFAAASYVFGWQWQSGLAQVPTSLGIVSRGYGLPSALPWYCLSALLSFAYALFSAGDRWRRVTAGVVGGGLVVLTAATLVRSNYVALVTGLAALLLVAAVWRGGWRALAHSVGWRRIAGAALLVALAVIGVGLAQPRNLSIVTQRATSVFAGGTSSGADHNRELRVEALEAGIRSAVQAPLGVGYGWKGDGRKMPTLAEGTVAYFADHSSFAWAGFYMGLAGLLIFCLGCVPLVGRLVRGCFPRLGMWWVSAAVVSAGLALLAQSLGAAVLFASPETFAVVPILLAAGLLPTRMSTCSVAETQNDTGEAQSSGRQRPRRRLLGALAGSSNRRWSLGRVTALAGVCLVGLSAILLAYCATGRTLSLGANVYGKPLGVSLAPGAPSVRANGRIVLRTRGYWPAVPVWFLPHGGSVSGEVRILQSEPCFVALSAFGAPAGGVGPMVSLQIDGVMRGRPRDIGYYASPYTWRLLMTRGVHRLRVTFLNSGSVNGQYRSLYIESLRVESIGGSPAPKLSGALQSGGQD